MAISLGLPILQIVVGLTLGLAIVLAVFFNVAYLPWASPLLVAFSCSCRWGPPPWVSWWSGRGKGLSGLGTTLAAALPYLLYTWLMWPVVGIGIWKQLRGSTTRAKTEREAVAPAST